MKTIKQKKNSDNCVAVTAANAFNSTVEEFELICGQCPENGYTDLDFYRFALYKGYTVGSGYNLSDTPLKNRNTVTMLGAITNVPAYVVVKSETRKGKTHAVYFDGDRVIDPNPDVKKPRKLHTYDVLLFYPIGSIDMNEQLRDDLMDKDVKEYNKSMRHECTLREGKTINVIDLILYCKKNITPERMKIDKIGGVYRSKRSGFSKKRYMEANIKYPIIVNQDNVLIDGRHRTLKMRDMGRKSIMVYKIHDDDIEREIKDVE